MLGHGLSFAITADNRRTERSVEFGHGHRMGARAAGAALDGVLHDKALGPVAGVGAVNFYEVRPEARVVLTQTAPTEPALPPRRLSTEPTKHRIS